MGTYAEDIAFVLSEAARFLRMDIADLRKLSFQDFISELPDPSGSGHIIIGVAAERRLRELADTAITRSNFSGRLNADSVLRFLKNEIVSRFSSKEGVTTKDADRAVGAAIRHASKLIEPLTHLMPCNVTSDAQPTSFALGPVVFRRREIALQSIDATLQKYKDHHKNLNDKNGSLTDKLATDARDYYGSFDWIAEIKIQNCDPITSREQAQRIVQNALDCVHLLTGAYSSRMRMGGPKFQADIQSTIVITDDGLAKLSKSVGWHSPHFGEDWWANINSRGADKLIHKMGIAIQYGTDLSSPSPLGQRFLDAAAWYGEAIRDYFPASRLVKYVTAIERILTTKNEEYLSETIASRGAAILVAAGVGTFAKDYKRLKRVYDMRSCIIHGSLSPHESGLGETLRDAEQLSRQIILSALPYYGLKGLQDRTLTIGFLDEAYDRLVRGAKTRENITS